jgi:NAD(P)-dependent dehydrogenase (short-subunit alcohol dehydrogenase family)
MYDLNGKVVLVTGGARGIGLAVGEAACRRGASVVLVDLDPAIAAESAEVLGDCAIGIGADVTDPDRIERAVEEAVERFGRVDVVVANAGIAPGVNPVSGVPTEDWERVLEVNLFGVWRTVRAGMDEVVKNGGQFVLVSSSYAYMNGVLNAAYASAKSGVEALGRSLRTELVPLGASATVAYFGWITTDMVTTAFSDPIVDGMRKTVPRFMTRQIPVGVAGEKVVEGIERRDPRVIVPFEYKVAFALRGLLGPLADRAMASDPRIAALVREAAARAAEPRS